MIVEIKYDVDGDYRSVGGVSVTCARCGHEVEIYGTSDDSIRRGCVMLRANFYWFNEDGVELYEGL